MLRSPFVAFPLLSALGSLLPAQASGPDAMWIAARQGRTLTKVSANGEVLQTVNLSGNGFDLRSVTKAPDGKLWVVNFITTTLTILDPTGANPQNLTTAGTAYQIAFDRLGVAWITLSNTGNVARYAPNGTLLGTIAVGPNPLGIAIDKAGNAWVAHRSPSGTRVSKIDATTFAATNYTLPSTTLQPVAVLCDSPNPAAPSNVWVAGDSSNEIFQLDPNGNVLNTIRPNSVATAGISDLTLDANNDIWASCSTRAEIYRIDDVTGVVAPAIPDAPSPIGLSTDSYGRVWVVNRVSFSGPAPAELRRFDPVTGAREAVAPVGIGAYNTKDPGGFQYAFVVDPNGDADGDGVGNAAEILQRTSPYDPQSNASLSLVAAGVSQPGQTLRISTSGTGVPVYLVWATGRGTPFALPGFTGTVRLDPTKLLPIAFLVNVPATYSIPLPNDPTLVGATFLAQAVRPATPYLLGNESGWVIF